MRVSCQITHGKMLISRPLDLPRTEQPIGITIDEQPQHHARRILFAAGSALVELGRTHIQQRQRIHQKMHKVIPANPFPQIHRQQQWCVPINIHKTMTHVLFDVSSPRLFNLSPTGSVDRRYRGGRGQAGRPWSPLQ